MRTDPASCIHAQNRPRATGVGGVRHHRVAGPAKHGPYDAPSIRGTMMRRQLLLLLVAMSLMLVLALPAAVQARQSWEVRDRAGHVWGKAVTTGTRTADIVKSGGRGRGRRVVRELR